MVPLVSHDNDSMTPTPTPFTSTFFLSLFSSSFPFL